MKNILHLFLAIMMFLMIGSSVAQAAEPSVGAINNWFSVNDATTLSIDMKPNYGESGYHYYSLSPYFQGKDYGLYSGI